MKKRHESKKRRRSSGKGLANRQYKDRFFRLVFRDKKDLLDLYNAVNGTHYENADELTITTLEDALFLGMKNDLSFIIGADLNLYEHQSTWTANMPLRGLFYFAGLYQEYIERNGYDLYGSRLIRLPFPNYLVFYNGEKSAPDRTELSLADAFEKSSQKKQFLPGVPSVNCCVTVLNINCGHNRELMERCRKLGEYAEFIGAIRANIGEGLELREAIDRAIADCERKGILTDLLGRCRTEVIYTLLTEYDEKKTMNYIRKEAEEIGRQEMAARLNRLNRMLLSEKRYEDLERSAEDEAYQKELLDTYGI